MIECPLTCATAFEEARDPARVEVDTGHVVAFAGQVVPFAGAVDKPRGVEFETLIELRSVFLNLVSGETGTATPRRTQPSQGRRVERHVPTHRWSSPRADVSIPSGGR